MNRRGAALGAVLLSFALGCGKGIPADPYAFPPGFLFGVAIAGFQVDMGCPTLPAASCEDRNSDWYQWVTTPALVGDSALYLNGDPPSSAPGFYELYPHDLDLAKDQLRSNALRLSIEWSRVFPNSTVGIEGYDALKAAANPDALAYYHAVFAAMRARGLSPLVTLNHYTLPLWIHDGAACHADIVHCQNRGWLDPRIVDEIAKYAGFVAREFGGEVDRWATLNEPFTAVVLSGYLLPTASRSSPPGVTLRWNEAKLALVNMIVAHARMADAVRANDLVDADGDGIAAQVGIVYNLEATSPRDPANPLDVAGAANLSYIINQVFLNGAINGDIDAGFTGQTVHRGDIAGRTDFLGINYYDRAVVEGLSRSPFPLDAPYATFNPFTLELNYDASGISEVLELARGWNLPLYISETGTTDPTDGGAGAAWVAETMTRVKRAMNVGIPVRGYFYWTLMDNYEWNHGMSLRFGLFGVDKSDPAKTRTPRPRIIDAFSRIAGSGRIPDDLVTPP